MNKPKDQSIKEILIALILGLMIGLIVFAFLKSLQWIEIQHLIWNQQGIPIHLVLLPFCLLFLGELKKRTLYFPHKVAHLTPKDLELTHHWNIWMTPFHFVGTLLSHSVGASVGREGAAVMMASGLVRVFRLSWAFWGPIAFCIGFSAVVGVPWISIILLLELFSTELRQKIYTLVGALTASLFLQTMHMDHLFQGLSFNYDAPFFQKLFFILLFGFVAGWMMKIYKWAYHRLADFFKTNKWYLKFFIATLLAAFLAQPFLQKFQSLGLLQINRLDTMSAEWSDVFIKLFVTLISVTLGFWGGEFIPLVYSGVHLGNVLAQFFQFDLTIGAALGAYLLFAGATRLKWTSYFLTLALLGGGWWFWSYILITICVKFSGPYSLYHEPDGII